MSRRTRPWLQSVFATILALAGLAGCASSPRSLDEYHRVDLPAHSPSPVLSSELYRQLVQQLRSGDIVLGAKEDPVNVLVRLITVEPTYFTHSGTIEVVDDGRGGRAARVWHAIGEFDLLHLSPHVLGKVRGGVRSTPLDEFIAAYDALAIIRLPDESRGMAAVEACREMQQRGVEFDPFVDCIDDSAICCTELTALSLERAGYPFDLRPAPRTRNQAISNLMTGWNITTPAIYMTSQFERLPGATPVAVISKYGRMETYLAMRDSVTMVHERVTAGRAQASDFAAFDSRRLLHFSPRYELLLRGVEGLAKAAPTMDQSEIRRRNEILYEAIMSPAK